MFFHRVYDHEGFSWGEASDLPQYRTTWIYFIQQGDSGPVKIGCSFEPTRRLKQLQTAHSTSLRLLCAVEANRDEERSWHDRFRNARTKGEWFQPTPVMDYLQREGWLGLSE